MRLNALLLLVLLGLSISGCIVEEEHGPGWRDHWHEHYWR
jgi:hypothetical protein